MIVSPEKEASVIPPARDPAGSQSRPSLAALLRGPFVVQSFALTIIMLFGVFGALYFARPVLMPLVFALLLSYLLAPVIRTGLRFRIPPSVTAALTILGGASAIAITATQLAEPAAGWLQKAPYSLHQIQDRLYPIKDSLGKVQAATAEVEKMTADPKNPPPPTVELNSHPISNVLMSQTPEMMATLLSTVILLYFLLASNGLFLRKLIKVTPRFSDKKRAVEIAHEVEACISRYLGTVTLVNLGLGTCVAISMALLHLPNPIFWGVLVAVLHFVPFLGAIVGLTAMTLASILCFSDLGQALLCPGVYLVYAVLEAQVITPMVLGRSLTLNPVSILVSLIFWSWIWGIPGALLAVPILAAFKIFCDHVEPLAAIGEFLSE
ncbi:MAG: AI-2E family transporter [Chthoniobacteraceae bacterium]